MRKRLCLIIAFLALSLFLCGCNPTSILSRDTQPTDPYEGLPPVELDKEAPYYNVQGGIYIGYAKYKFTHAPHSMRLEFFLSTDSEQFGQPLTDAVLTYKNKDFHLYKNDDGIFTDITADDYMLERIISVDRKTAKIIVVSRTAGPLWPGEYKIEYENYDFYFTLKSQTITEESE